MLDTKREIIARPRERKKRRVKPKASRPSDKNNQNTKKKITEFIYFEVFEKKKRKETKQHNTTKTIFKSKGKTETWTEPVSFLLPPTPKWRWVQCYSITEQNNVVNGSSSYNDISHWSDRLQQRLFPHHQDHGYPRPRHYRLTASTALVLALAAVVIVDPFHLGKLRMMMMMCSERIRSYHRLMLLPKRIIRNQHMLLLLLLQWITATTTRRVMKKKLKH